MAKQRLRWADHAWCKQGALVKQVIEDLMGKRPLDSLKLRWEDCVKKDVKKKQWKSGTSGKVCI